MKYFLAIFQNKEENDYVGVVPDIDNCYAYGDSLEELYESIQDTTELLLEDESLPKANSSEYFKDEILQRFDIPLESSKGFIEVTEDEDNSYTARVILDS